MDDNLTEQFTAEITEFAALLRARITGAADPASPPGGSPAERMWQDVYGAVPLPTDDPQEIARLAGQLVHRKLLVATVFVVSLAAELGSHTGRTVAEVVDGLERQLVDEGVPDCQVCGDRPKPGYYCADCGRQG